MIKLADHLDRALAKFAERKRTYLVENPEEDDFDALLAQSGCVDVGGYLGMWKRRAFELSRGYSPFRHYVTNSLRRRTPASTKTVIVDLGFKLFVGQATTREILRFYIGHRTVLDLLLDKESRIVGLGRDDFSYFRGTSAVISRKKGRTILEAIPTHPGSWTRSDVFVSRASRS